MRILVYGCGAIGRAVIEQLQKNKDIRIVTMDPRDNPEALEEGVVESIDIDDVLTPMILDELVEEWHPDLILLATASSDLALGHAPGVDMLMDSLWAEIASISSVPVVPVERRAGSMHDF
jgi:nucleoside-diphosphate-sugar epimerase